MGAKKTTLAFVILTWNSERVIERCVRSVFALKSFDVSAYVVDNGSSDKTVGILDALTQEYSQLHVIKRAVNEGTTVPRNLALKEISPDTDYICVLDSDTEVNDDAIQAMVKTLDNKRVGIVGPEMRNEEGVLQNSGRKVPTLTIKLSKVLPFKKAQRWGESLEFYSYPSDQKVVPVGYLMSACWMFRWTRSAIWTRKFFMRLKTLISAYAAGWLASGLSKIKMPGSCIAGSAFRARSFSVSTTGNT